MSLSTHRRTVPAAVKFAVIRRSLRDGVACCELCGEPLGEIGVDSALHHRRFRDGAYDQHTPQNLLAVCGADNVTGCHGLIHSGKRWAMNLGYAISRHGNVDPLTRSVLIDRGSRDVYLTADGEYADAPEVADA